MVAVLKGHRGKVFLFQAILSLSGFTASILSYLVLERSPSASPLYRKLFALSVARVSSRDGLYGNIRSSSHYRFNRLQQCVF